MWRPAEGYLAEAQRGLSQSRGERRDFLRVCVAKRAGAVRIFGSIAPTSESLVPLFKTLSLFLAFFASPRESPPRLNSPLRRGETVSRRGAESAEIFFWGCGSRNVLARFPSSGVLRQHPKVLCHFSKPFHCSWRSLRLRASPLRALNALCVVARWYLAEAQRARSFFRVCVAKRAGAGPVYGRVVNSRKSLLLSSLQLRAAPA